MQVDGQMQQIKLCSVPVGHMYVFVCVCMDVHITTDAQGHVATAAHWAVFLLQAMQVEGQMQQIKLCSVPVGHMCVFVWVYMDAH